jgi:RNA polymerase sigma-70 factor (ECF subfamily)
MDSDLLAQAECANAVLDSTFRDARKALVGVAARITRNVADAEDIVQSAFLRASERRVALPAPYMRRWVATVVRHLAVDHIRKRMADERFAAALSGLDIEDAGSSGAVMPMPTIEDLNAAISVLPKASQPTFRLWCAGASYAAIARECRIPISTVATRIFRAKERLRALYPALS